MNETSLFTQRELAIDPIEAAQLLLGCVLEADTPGGVIGLRVVEVEAYRGFDDPASHSYRGKTPRNAVMFGPAGFLYMYFIYGMHYCANVVCMPDGVPGAVLFRAGEVVAGIDTARRRRPSARNDAELAKGPARLASLLGLTRSDNGIDLLQPDSAVRLLKGQRISEELIEAGPRVGITAAADDPLRFWVADSPAVSSYRRGGKRKSTLTEKA